MAIKSIVRDSGKFLYDNFHFSEAVESDGLLLCSGIIGTGQDGKVPEDIREEFDNAWSGVISLLEEAGADASHIVEYTSYHVGLQADMAAFMEVRDKYLGEPWPAWTAIGITELAVPGAHVEIRVTAKLS
ncbi:MAG: RidA family protein [Pseudomonadales bacterium]|nr:RidA family protein [Pseudomonadales bacterium]